MHDVRAAIRGRDERLDGPSDHLVTREAEQSLRLRVHHDDRPLGVGDHHRVGDSVQERLERPGVVHGGSDVRAVPALYCIRIAAATGSRRR
jgi:hypothetical protein